MAVAAVSDMDGWKDVGHIVDPGVTLSSGALFDVNWHRTRVVSQIVKYSHGRETRVWRVECECRWRDPYRYGKPIGVYVSWVAAMQIADDHAHSRDALRRHAWLKHWGLA